MPRARSQVLSGLAALLLFVCVAAVILAAGVRRPFVWIWVVALPISVVSAVRASSEALRRLALAAFGVALSLAALEVVFQSVAMRSPRLRMSGTVGRPGYITEDAELGYAPGGGIARTSRAMLGKQVVYDVAYTISPQRVRVTKGDPDGDTWLFFGCSYQFGEGAKDDETLPAFFSQELRFRANVVNLGFSGYGPHQTLRMLETDRARPLVHGAVRQVVYTAMWHHPARAAGRDSWDFRGPRYVLRGDTVAFAGPLHGRVGEAALKLLWRSALFKYVLERTYYDPNPSDEEIERFARILEQSARLVKEQYGAGFTVVYWDEDLDASRRVLARLQKTRLPVVLVSSVIPRAEWPALKYVMDQHPMPEANRRVAHTLAVKFGTD